MGLRVYFKHHLSHCPFCSAVHGKEWLAFPAAHPTWLTLFAQNSHSWVLYSVPVQNKVLLLSDICLRSSSKFEGFRGNPKNTSHLLKFRFWWNLLCSVPGHRRRSRLWRGLKAEIEQDGSLASAGVKLNWGIRCSWRMHTEGEQVTWLQE